MSTGEPREPRDPRQPGEPRDLRDPRLPGEPRDVRDKRRKGDPEEFDSSQWRRKPVTRLQVLIAAVAVVVLSNVAAAVGLFIFGVQQDEFQEQQRDIDYALCLVAKVNRQYIVNGVVQGAQTLGDFALAAARERGEPEAEIRKTEEQIKDFVEQTRLDAEEENPAVICHRDGDQIVREVTTP